MQKIKFIHTSDLQLGMKGGFLSEEARPRFGDARLESITKLGKLAEQNDCAFIVIAGDVFEYTTVDERVFGRACEKFKNVPVPVYLLPGNHDHFLPGSVLEKLDAKLENCHVLSDTQPVDVRSSEGRILAQLVGAPLDVRVADQDLVAQAVSNLEPTDLIRVVVGHGQPTKKHYGEKDKPGLIDVDALIPLFEQGVIDYLALGDTHSTEEIKPQVWFSGSPEVTNFVTSTGGGESNSGNALIVEIEKVAGHPAQVSVETKHIGSWRFRELHETLQSEDDVKEFTNKLRDIKDKDRTVIRYCLEGGLSLSAWKTLEAELNELEHLFAGLEENPHQKPTLTLQPTGEEIEESGVVGIAKEALDELLEDAREGSEAAKNAAQLLIRLWSSLEGVE